MDSRLRGNDGLGIYMDWEDGDGHRSVDTALKPVGRGWVLVVMLVYWLGSGLGAGLRDASTA